LKHRGCNYLQFDELVFEIIYAVLINRHLGSDGRKKRWRERVKLGVWKLKLVCKNEEEKERKKKMKKQSGVMCCVELGWVRVRFRK